MPDDNSPQGGNPAWESLLGEIPEDLHEKITPHLQEWDRGVQQRFASYEPYKEFLDGGVDAENLRMGLGLLQAIEQDPKSVYEALGQQFQLQKKEPEQPAGIPPELEGLPPAAIKRIQEMEEKYNNLFQGHEAIAQKLVNDDRAAEEAREDQILDRKMSELREKYGEYDEGYVLAKMHAGMKPEDAVESWNQLVDGIVANRRPPAPKILGNGSVAMPGDKKIDVTKLGPKDTKNLVAQMLEDAVRET